MLNTFIEEEKAKVDKFNINGHFLETMEMNMIKNFLVSHDKRLIEKVVEIAENIKFEKEELEFNEDTYNHGYNLGLQHLSSQLLSELNQIK